MSSVGIIGGGLIGAASATWLRAEGHEVTLIEADPDARHASSGNAGVLAVPETDPLASLETLLSVPRYLLDPLGPLSLRWRDLPSLTPWLTRFALSARPAQMRRSGAALSFLMRSALSDHMWLGEMAGLKDHFSPTGAIKIFDREDRLDAGFNHLRQSHADLGHKIQHLTPSEIRTRVPALTGPVAGGIFLPDYQTVTDPRLILEGLRQHLHDTAQLVHGKVTHIEPSTTSIHLKIHNGPARQFDRILIAAGVWSRDLVRQLGLKVLLETERGYNTTWAHSPIDLPLPINFSDFGFFASPLNGQLRVGGAVELADVNAPPHMARAGTMRKIMRRYFPDLPDGGGVEWMGRRPSTPDSIPVISAHPKDPRIVMAFGHGHLGLTLSAVTARHVTTLMQKNRASDELAPFSISRFQ